MNDAAAETLKDLMPLTPDLNAERLAKLKELFPDLFTDEGGLNESELKKLVDPKSVNEIERYEFRWFGKSNAKRKAFTPTTATLNYDAARSVNPEQTENLIIEGENLKVLKLLLCSYREQIKCIYIDPPYNTGNDFVYSDNYSEDRLPYWKQTGVMDEHGVKIDTNADTDGRYHSNWMNMMFSRLLVARQLLSKDGVIFISIDDNEVHNLRRICNEVFGEDNFITSFIWDGGRKNDAKKVSISHEYILAYAKSEENNESETSLWRERKKGIDLIYKAYEKLAKENANDWLAVSKGLAQWFRSLPNDEPAKRHSHYSNADINGVYFASDLSGPDDGRENRPRYEVIHPKTGKPVPIPRRGWRWELPRMKKEIKSDRVHFGVDETTVPNGKVYLKENEYEAPSSVFYKDRRSSSAELKLLLEGKYFDFPKDSSVIARLIQLVTQKDEIILDFFGGSGTTGQAIMELNEADGGNRKFILVQLPELTDEKSEAYKAGYKRISDITIERNKRVVNRIIEEKRAKHPNLFEDGAEQDALKGLGFKVFQLESSYFPRTEWSPNPEADEAENVLSLKQYIAEKESQLHIDFDQSKLLTELLLKEGFKLNYTARAYEAVRTNNVSHVSDADKEALICLDESIAPETIEHLKTHKDLKFICLERALDTTKKWNLANNLGEKFKAF